ncbi:bifunctional tetrahydrofolate synthase/dihydrofolate synthase [Thalassotalea sp. SU-HH00458]|uniref:bifunctional tetrahydrofolate synthase/dihydrofolate synthase n=1 Tax=Thalassotalea sp. SU-HH00458 TaxID=3127657 RepID=UPI0031054695
MKETVQSHSSRNLDEWLSYLESIHSTEIDMGLERISKVAENLAIEFEFTQVITVAGTNGKGTTCAFLENAILAEDRSVAVYSSPHIEKFNERLRINKQDVDDKAFILAFENIEQSRGDISLTYYEYTTLAALLIIMVEKPDFAILEVGLGGRLDATNIIDADIAVITTVDLDHQAFLGDNRESIGFEKAGIMRAGQRVVIGDKHPPQSVLAHAKQLNTQVYIRGVDFNVDFNELTHGWGWQSHNYTFNRLPQPFIPRDNIATAIMVLELLGINVDETKLVSLITSTKVAGRTELIAGHCKIMLDVGHNPLAARYLVEQIPLLSATKVHAVVAMLADKDIFNTLNPLLAAVDCWYMASLDMPRGANAEQLKSHISNSTNQILTFDNVIDAYKMALSQAKESDLILVFGSFFTVAQVKGFLN